MTTDPDFAEALRQFHRSLEIHGCHVQIPGLYHPSLCHVVDTIDVAMLAESPELMSGWWDR